MLESLLSIVKAMVFVAKTCFFTCSHPTFSMLKTTLIFMVKPPMFVVESPRSWMLKTSARTDDFFPDGGSRGGAGARGSVKGAGGGSGL